jgi:hypothetical protein
LTADSFATEFDLLNLPADRLVVLNRLTSFPDDPCEDLEWKRLSRLAPFSETVTTEALSSFLGSRLSVLYGES